jgi:hypothetical protein
LLAKTSNTRGFTLKEVIAEVSPQNTTSQSRKFHHRRNEYSSLPFRIYHSVRLELMKHKLASAIWKRDMAEKMPADGIRSASSAYGVQILPSKFNGDKH